MANRITKTGPNGWRYPLSSVTLDNRVQTSSIRPGFCPVLQGVDGRVQGGLRPHFGFKHVHTLGSTSVPYTPTTVSDLFSFDLQAGALNILGGFVTRITTATDEQIYFEWVDELGVWQSLLIATNTLSPGLPGQMDVAFNGRLLYIFRANTQPILVYFVLTDPTALHDDSTNPWIPKVVTDTGPGIRPTAPILTPSTGSGSDTLLEPGDYSFAFVLRDTATGRLSPLSEIGSITTNDFPLDPNTGDPLPQLITFSFGADTQATLFGIDANGTPNTPSAANLKWDQLRVYRSVRTEFLGASVNSSILQLENTLSVVFNAAQTEHVNLNAQVPASDTYSFTLPDLALRYQNVYPDKFQFDEDMPFAQAATFHSGILFTSSNRSSTDGFSGIGEIRWSSAVEVAPELFPPDNTFPTLSTTDEPLRFLQAGDILFGLTAARIYAMSRFGAFPSRPSIVHDGYGLVHSRAAVSIASTLYFITPLGLVSIDASGNLKAITVVDRLLLSGSWATTLSSIRASYDAPSACIYFHNTALDETLCFWLNTSMVSTLTQTPFTASTDGIDPTSSTSEKRSFFCTATGAIFIPDTQRTKIDTLTTSPVYSLLDLQGARASAAISSPSPTSLTLNVQYPSSLSGSYLTFISGASKGLSVKSLTFTPSSGATVVTFPASTIPSNVLGSDAVVISPIQFKVRGWPIGAFVDPNNIPIFADQFRARTIQSIGAHFQATSGLSILDPLIATYTASAYVGQTSTPAASSRPIARDGATAIVSITDDTTPFWARLSTSGVRGSIIFPEISIVVADIDFVLIGFTVSGSIESFDAQT